MLADWLMIQLLVLHAIPTLISDGLESPSGQGPPDQLTYHGRWVGTMAYLSDATGVSMHRHAEGMRPHA